MFNKLVLSALFTVFLSVSASALTLQERVVEHKLKNGMKFFLLQRPNVPVFSSVIYFKAGSNNENAGCTGIAHLLEHMAFKGTKVIGTTDYDKEKLLLKQIEDEGEKLTIELKKGKLANIDTINKSKEKIKKMEEGRKKYIVKEEFMTIMNKNGSSGLNAGTGKDFTMYTVSLPVNKLELWAFLESDRLANLQFREFYTERDVINEERRASSDTNPQSKLMEQFLATAFTASPYHWPVIGWPSDIATLSLKETLEFRKKYYVPNNAVGALVGDINIEETKKILDKYFDSIPAGPTPPPLTTYEPVQEGEKRVNVEFDAEPFVFIGFHKPTFPDKDDVVISFIDSILSNGKSSRLYKKIVKEQKMALNVFTSNGFPGTLLDNLIVMGGSPISPYTTADIEKSIYEELEKLQKEPVTDQELQKVRNAVKMDFIQRSKSNDDMANILSIYEVLCGNWKEYFRYQDLIDTITADDIMKAAQKYFVPANRTVATLVKKANSGK